jgi:hypothetical protein
MALIGAGALAVALLSLCASCSLGGTKQTEHEATSAAPGEQVRTFSDRGISLRYPRGWSVAGFSTTVSPARLAVASYQIPADADPLGTSSRTCVVAGFIWPWSGYGPHDCCGA